MKRTIATLTISSLVLIVGTATRAQDGPPEYGMPISAQQASAVAAAAVETMAENGWRMAVSVVDPAGHLVHFEKVDGTQNASIEISMRKAQAAAGFRRSTRVFAQGIANNPALATLPGVVGSPGGVPIVVDGRIVGAVGCSGGTGDQDEIACEAGAAAAQ